MTKALPPRNSILTLLHLGAYKHTRVNTTKEQQLDAKQNAKKKEGPDSIADEQPTLRMRLFPKCSFVQAQGHRYYRGDC